MNWILANFLLPHFLLFFCFGVLERMCPFVLSSVASEAKKRRLERFQKLKAKRARLHVVDALQGASLGCEFYLSIVYLSLVALFSCSTVYDYFPGSSSTIPIDSLYINLFNAGDLQG
jgi:hypothetical protein